MSCGHDFESFFRELRYQLANQPMRRVVRRAGVPDRSRPMVSQTVAASTGAATAIRENGRRIYWAQFRTTTEGPVAINVYLSEPASGSANAGRPYATLMNGGTVAFPGGGDGDCDKGVPEFWVRSATTTPLAGCDMIVSFDRDDAGDVVPGSPNPLSATTLSTTTIPVTTAGNYTASSGTATLNAGAGATNVLTVSTGLLFHGDLLVFEKHVGAAVGTPRAWIGEVWDLFYAGGATNDVYPMIPPTPTGIDNFLVCEVPEGITGGVGNISFRVNNPDTVQCTYRAASLTWR